MPLLHRDAKSHPASFYSRQTIQAKQWTVRRPTFLVGLAPCNSSRTSRTLPWVEPFAFGLTVTRFRHDQQWQHDAGRRIPFTQGIAFAGRQGGSLAAFGYQFV
jgi:hypothetical protein